MKISLFAYSRRGIAAAERIMKALAGDDIKAFTAERLAEGAFAPIPKPSAPLYEEAFRTSDALIFVGSCGIAVRSFAPYLRSKAEDPAVICVDELGTFVIPLLSGHIGGANRLAEGLAESLGAKAVITTATDINHRFSVDKWAAEQGFMIDDLKTAKEISSAILERDVPLLSDLPVKGSLPPGTFGASRGELGIYVGFKDLSPFERTLRIIPKVLRLGIGCRRGTSVDAIEKAVRSVLKDHGIDPRSVKSAASIDLKKDEAGLLEFCSRWELPAAFYTADELRSVPGDFTPSPFVEKVTGVDNVCERAAAFGGGRIIVKKTAMDGVTCAVAMEDTEVSFE